MAYLDSRDLQERLEELEAMEEAYRESVGTSMPEAPLDDDETAELAELRELADEVTEWEYGATLIPTYAFEDYARELAEDIGAVDKEASWPNCHIDWEAAADSLSQDYTEVTYQGTDYYVRSY